MNDRVIEVSYGPEDFALQKDGPRGPRLLVAARDRRPFRDHRGSIWSIDLPGGDRKKLALPKDVRPTGITVAGRQLYVTNEQSIEVFDLDGDTISGGTTLSHPDLKQPNDVLVAPNGDLYVSDSKAGIVYRVSGGRWKPFADEISIPNGLATDGPTLYVSALGSKELRLYDCTSGELRKTLPLDDHPDNLQWEVEGRVLNVAAHVSKTKIFKHMFVSASISSPSAAYRIDVGSLTIIKRYDLPHFNGASSALVYEGKLYVSQVIENHILVQDA